MKSYIDGAAAISVLGAADYIVVRFDSGFEVLGEIEDDTVVVKTHNSVARYRIDREARIRRLFGGYKLPGLPVVVIPLWKGGVV